MVTLEQLEALDLAIWLRTTDRAAAMIGTNQSTVSRRSRAALEAFRLTPGRGSEVGGLRGENELLQLERLVHQRARLRGLQPLRLQVPVWTRRMPQWCLPEGWCANPTEHTLACEDPVGLLRDRVIDACLITSCQLPAQTDDLVLFELYRRPIELTLFAQRVGADGHEVFRHQRDAGALTLEPMKFLPNSCARNAAGLFEVLTGAAPSRSRSALSVPPPLEAVSVSFLTPEMRAVQERPCLVDDDLEPCPYIERLVLLADNLQHASVQRLLNQLLPPFESLLA